MQAAVLIVWGLSSEGMESQLVGLILSHAQMRMIAPSAEGAKGGFRACGYGAVAFRSSLPFLRFANLKQTIL